MSKKILTQIIMQTWWHFEDYYSENPFQKRRYVQDIYLYKDQVDDADFENTLRVILPKNIFNIHARMRNPNKELAYVVATAPRSENESDEDIVMYIHLPNLDELPVVEIERKNKVIQCLHLKLEIEYSQNKYKSNLGKKDFEEGGSIAHFNLLMFMKKTLPRKCYLKRFQLTIDIIISRLIHKWDNVLSIDYDKTYPEFSLTLPKGWMLRKNDKDGQISVYANCGDSTPTPLDVLAPAEEFIDGKRHYVSILSDMGNETYNRVLAETSSPLKPEFDSLI